METAMVMEGDVKSRTEGFGTRLGGLRPVQGPGSKFGVWD